jgi:translation initiation factor 1 (eIF-1/SUI1)
MGEVIQLQGDHRIKIRDFLVNEETGLALDEKNIKVRAIDRSAAVCQPSLTT